MTNVFGAMAYAYLADITTPEGRSKSFGAYMAVYGFAAIFGPTLSGYLEDQVLQSYSGPEGVTHQLRASSAWHCPPYCIDCDSHLAGNYLY